MGGPVREEREAQVARPVLRGVAIPPLQPPHRTNLHPMGQAIHSLPQHPPPGRGGINAFLTHRKTGGTIPRQGNKAAHHIDESLVQKSVRDAVATVGLSMRATCHTFQHNAAQLLEGGYDIRTVQDLLGHSDVKTTMILPMSSTAARQAFAVRWTGFERLKEVTLRRSV